jgi:hypothetical protein
MITIKQHNKKWRIKIENEEWEFEDAQRFREELLKLISIKEEHGQVKNET